jgi:general stress protein YciG
MKQKRGFAAMDPTLQKALARKGGQTAHTKGTAHRWTAEEAREAGKKGGAKVALDRGYMAALGRLSHPAKLAKQSDGPTVRPSDGLTP